MIRFSCQQCGKNFKAPAELAGRTVSCSACGTKQTVPYPEFQSSSDNLQDDSTAIQDDAEEQKEISFEGSKRAVFEDLVDMTAMVDIVFFLLIFFMVTSMQGLYSAIGIPPPSAEKASSQAKRDVSEIETDSVVVRIDNENVVWIGDEKILSEQELRTRLRSAREGEKGAEPMKKMLILGSGDAHTVSVVKAIDAGNSAGMDEVQLALDNASE